MSGRVQINLPAPDPYDDHWFINACKTQTDGWYATGASEDFNLLLDSRGYPTRMATGANWSTASLYIYGVPGDVWVLDWPNATSTLQLVNNFTSGSISESVISSTRREYTLVGPLSGGTFSDGVSNFPALLCHIVISAMASNDFAGNTTPGGQIRLYPKTLEASLNGGEIVHPDFLARVQFGVHRSMDAHKTNNSLVTLWSHRKTSNDYSYCSWKLDSTAWCGSSSGTNAQVVGQPSSAIVSWTNGQLVQWQMTNIPTFFTPTACTNASPGVFQLTAHGFSNGDILEAEPRSGAWAIFTESDTLGGTGSSFSAHTVTVVDVNHFSLGVDTTSFGAYPADLHFYKQVTLKVGALAPIACCRASGISNFFTTEFTAGHYMTGVYNSTLGRIVTQGDGGFDLLNAPMPLETLVALANKTSSHPWFNIPVMADDTYIQNHFDYVDANLTTGLKPRYEYGNEIWNFGTPFALGTNYANVMAARTSPLNLYYWNYWYGYKVAKIKDLTVGHFSRITPEVILALQAVQMNTSITVDRFQCPPYSAGDPTKYPINKADAIAYNGYWDPPFCNGNGTTYPNFVRNVWLYTQGGASRTAAFDWMKAQCQSGSDDPINFPVQQPLNYYRDTVLPFWINAAQRTYGKNVYEYEAGHTINKLSYGFPATDSISGNSVSILNALNFTQDFFKSQQYADCVTQHANDFINGGGLFPSQFVISGPWNDGAAGTNLTGYYWPMWQLNDFAAGATLAWTALKAVNDNIAHRGGRSWLGRFGEIKISLRQALLFGVGAAIIKNPRVSRRKLLSGGGSP